jgi:hypothetical protein
VRRAARLGGGLVTRTRHLRVHADPRGVLLPVDLDDVPFPVRRIFVVTGPEGGAERGGHLVSCHELVVLVAGRAEIRIGADAEELPETVVLDQPGDAVQLGPDEFMAYSLGGASSILVLADRAYAAPEQQQVP